MHILYYPDNEDWDSFLSNHTIQFGGGTGTYAYFQGTPLRLQHGTGIGSILQSIFKFLVPLGKDVGRTLGNEGLRTTSRILNNVVQGSDLKSAFKQESKTGLRNVLEKAAKSLSQEGGGRPRKKILYARQTHPPKRRRKDALGYY